MGSDSYDLAEGLIYSYPVRCRGGGYRVVEGLDVNEFSRQRMDISERELREEADAVKALLG